MIEIRLDRRQAFYGVVGSLLIVSVAFVVGLIVGQRMQLIEDAAPLEPSVVESDEEAAGSDLVAAAEPEENPDYTFYDELRSNPPRPLLLPSQDGIGEPATAIRSLDRQPPTPSSDDATADDGDAPAEGVTPAPAPAPQPRQEPTPVPQPPAAPEPERSPRLQPAEPEPSAVARANPAVAPVDDDVASAPRITRRAVRRADDGAPAASPQEFGFFTVEAGTFDDFAAATARRNELRQGGHDAIVTIVAPNDGPREYRVQIGSYTRRAEADEVASQVGRLGIRARVVQEG